MISVFALCFPVCLLLCYSDNSRPQTFLIYNMYHAILLYLKMWYEWEISFHFLRGIFYLDPYHPLQRSSASAASLDSSWTIALSSARSTTPPFTTAVVGCLKNIIITYLGESATFCQKGFWCTVLSDISFVWKNLLLTKLHCSGSSVATCGSGKMVEHHKFKSEGTAVEWSSRLGGIHLLRLLNFDIFDPPLFAF